MWANSVLLMGDDGNGSQNLSHQMVFRTDRIRVSCQVANHRYGVLVVSILAIHALLLAWAGVMNSPASDEIGHLPAGLSHWQSGNFDLYRVNPPLMRMIAAIPLLIVNPKTDWSSISEDPWDRAEFTVGERFVEINGSATFWLFTLGRWAQIPVSIFGGWICYRWSRDLYGDCAGLIALILWCFCPNILAWGAMITPDLGATVFGVAAGYSFWRWLKAPTWTAAIVSGLGLGLAELSKSTWIVLFFIWPALWMVWRFTAWREQPKPRATQLVCILLLGIYLLNLAYGFEGSFQPLNRFNFISSSLRGATTDFEAGNRFRDHWIGGIPVPLPANYVRGIDIQRGDFERGKWAYLGGTHKFRGWYHYYLYAFAVKIPLGTLCLFAYAAVVTAIRRQSSPGWKDQIVLLVPPLLVFLLVSSQIGLNRHFRYVLPVLPFLYVFISQVASVVEINRVIPRSICLACIASTIIGSLSVYPHSISYFNLAAGGPRGGPNHLLDSNIDWGQDLLELRRFVARHPDVRPLRLSYFGDLNPRLAGIEFEQIPRLHDRGDWSRAPKLKAGWYAISVNHLFGYYYHGPTGPDYRCFLQFTPDHMAGYSIYIYHITPEKQIRLNDTIRRLAD
jgi:4-amino-4-deoxy-L-arabinose transferase-like glycosyltransferase